SAPARNGIHFVPSHVRKERVEVAGYCSTEVHLVAVLVHVHHERGEPRRECLSMGARPRGAKGARIELKREHHPAATSAEAAPGRPEVLLPARRAAVRLAERSL